MAHFFKHSVRLMLFLCITSSTVFPGLFDSIFRATIGTAVLLGQGNQTLTNARSAITDLKTAGAGTDGGAIGSLTERITSSMSQIARDSVAGLNSGLTQNVNTVVGAVDANGQLLNQTLNTQGSAFTGLANSAMNQANTQATALTNAVQNQGTQFNQTLNTQGSLLANTVQSQGTGLNTTLQQQGAAATGLANSAMNQANTQATALTNAVQNQGTQFNQTLNTQGSLLANTVQSQGTGLNTTLQQQGAAATGLANSAMNQANTQATALTNTMQNQGTQFNQMLNAQGSLLSDAVQSQGAGLNTTLQQQGVVAAGLASNALNQVNNQVTNANALVQNQGSQLTQALQSQATTLNATLQQQSAATNGVVGSALTDANAQIAAVNGMVQNQSNQLTGAVQNQISGVTSTVNNSVQQGLASAQLLVPDIPAARAALATVLIIQPFTSHIKWAINEIFDGALKPAFVSSTGVLNSMAQDVFQPFATGLKTIKENMLSVMRATQFTKLSTAQFTEYMADKKAALDAFAAGIGDGTVGSIVRMMDELERSYFTPYMARDVINKVIELRQVFADGVSKLIRGALQTLPEADFLPFSQEYQHIKSLALDSQKVFDIASGGLTTAMQSVAAVGASAAQVLRDAYAQGAAGVATSVAGTSTVTSVGGQQIDPVRTNMGVATVTTTDPFTGTASTVAVRRGG